MHIFLLTVFNVFKNVCQTYVNLCTLWMHYLSWYSSVLKQRRIISESNEPQPGPCGVPCFPSRHYHSMGLCYSFSLGRSPASRTKSFFSGNGTLRFYRLWALLQIQEERCGTAGSCWRVYLHLYLTLPWIWNDLFSLDDLSTFLEPQNDSFEGLLHRNLYKKRFMVYQPRYRMLFSIRGVP